MDYGKLKKVITVEIDGLTLMGIHGACCLALRHPKFTGPTRKIILNFINLVEKEMVRTGALTKEDLKYIHRTEYKASQQRDREIKEVGE